MRLGDKKSVLAVRVNEDFANWLNDHATSSGLSVSDYVRFILEGFKRDYEVAQAIKDYQANYCGNQSPDKHDKL